MLAAAAQAAQRPCLPGETILVIQEKLYDACETQQTPLIVFTHIRRDKVDLPGPRKPGFPPKQLVRPIFDNISDRQGEPYLGEFPKK